MKEMRDKFFLILIIFLNIFFLNIFYGEIIITSNEYIYAGIDRKNGRIVIGTIEGDPSNPLDNNKPLLYSGMPATSLIAIYVDGETVIYGSTKGKWIRKPYLDGDKVVSSWQYKNLFVINALKPVHNPSTGFKDNILISCSVTNYADKSKVGIAIILDVQLGTKEARFFNIAERGFFSNETQVAEDDIPLYWYTVDDIENQAIKIQGILYKYGAIKPDRVIFSTWDRLSDLWGFNLNTGYDFRRRGTTQYDGTVGIFYDPKELYKNANLEAATIYGVMGANTLTEGDFLLTLNVPKEPKELPIPIVAMLVNRSSEEIERLSLNINIPEGFYLESGEKQVVATKISPGGLFQYKWNISTEAAGGNFYVKAKADVFQNNQLKTIEIEEPFYANFYKKSGKITKTRRSNEEKEADEYISPDISSEKKSVYLNSDEVKLKKIEKMLSEVDDIYETWIEIYKSVFQDKNYSMEQIDKALNEIEKEIEYFNTIISEIK